MKKQNDIQFFKTGIVLILSVFLFEASNISAQTQTIAQNTNLTIASTNPPPGFATRLDYIKSFTNEDDALRAYRSGLITKSEAMAAHLLIGNLKQQDFYGKIIDQDGHAVPEATVIGYLRSDEGFGINDEKIEEYKT